MHNTHLTTRPINLNDAPSDPEYKDGGCALILVGAAACAVVAWRLLTAYTGYATLTAEETHEYAMRVQSEWHWRHYSSEEQKAILRRVLALVAHNPKSYLAKVYKQVYR